LEESKLLDVSDAAYITVNGEKHLVHTTSPLDNIVNFDLDKKDHLWIDSHFRAFVGIKAKGMYGITDLQLY
jgi:hypothetical protein